MHLKLAASWARLRLSRKIAVAAALLVGVSGTPAVIVAATTPAAALANGLAKTPPMGFNDWNAFKCDVNDALVRQTADFFVSSGMKAAGYDYVNIDDCWMGSKRHSDGSLAVNTGKFPHGMKAVADYVHSRGLKFGIYSSAGLRTCKGYPGSYKHEKQDAATFAQWGVDYLKYDTCNMPWADFPSHEVAAKTVYQRMHDALAATGRPIVFSICNGSDSQAVKPWIWGPAIGNLWRTTIDIRDTWGFMLRNYRQNVLLSTYAGPGAWNDPDMLEVGNGGMTDTEYRSHFTLWAQMAAPLIAGTDLRKASKATMAIYLNKAVIAIDQDPLGKQGYEISTSTTLHVLTKPLANGDRSVVLFNSGDASATITTTASAAGLGGSQFTLTDLWANSTGTTTGAISASVPAHGVVAYRVHRTD